MNALVLTMHILGNSENTTWKPDDNQVCTVKLGRWGAQIKNNPESCCKAYSFITDWFQRELAIFCHRPYLLTNIMIEDIVILGFVLTIMFPLVVGLIPPEPYSDKVSVSKRRFVIILAFITKPK